MDDLTFALKDKNSLDLSLKIINKFCDHAGSKINMYSTRVFKDMYDEINGVKATNKALRCWGIYIGHDKEVYITSILCIPNKDYICKV